MQQRRFVIGALVIAAAVGYLVYAGVRETSVYYLTVQEFLGRRESLRGTRVRVAGRVRQGSVSWDPRTLHLAFTLGGFRRSEGVPVRYTGVLPDMFAEGRDVIVEGRYDADGTLEARSILTSCPSKYEPARPGG